jgi:hypothetical protein
MFDNFSFFSDDEFLPIIESSDASSQQFSSTSSSISSPSEIPDNRETTPLDQFKYDFSPNERPKSVTQPNFDQSLPRISSSFKQTPNLPNLQSHIFSSPNGIPSIFYVQCPNSGSYFPIQCFVVPFNYIPQFNQNPPSDQPFNQSNFNQLVQEPLNPSLVKSANMNCSSSEQISDQFKLEFLTFVAQHFSSTLKEEISNLLKSFECPSSMKFSMSSRKFLRIAIPELIKFIEQHSSAYFDLMSEEKIISLFFKVYEDSFRNVPSQKKFRYERFVQLYSLLLKQFVSNGKLAEFQPIIRELYSHI